jgi:hypothetical protein
MYTALGVRQKQKSIDGLTIATIEFEKPKKKS